MFCRKLTAKSLLVGAVLGVLLGAGILADCGGDTGPVGGRDSGGAAAGEDTSAREGGVSGGEHGGVGEGAEVGGEQGSGGEGSGATLGLGETFDMVRGGARLILGYDAPSNSFKGTVENTTNSVLSRVRIEVHLSNGTELGPTAPVDLAPGEVVAVNLPSTAGIVHRVGSPCRGWQRRRGGPVGP